MLNVESHIKDEWDDTRYRKYLVSTLTKSHGDGTKVHKYAFDSPVAMDTEAKRDYGALSENSQRDFIDVPFTVSTYEIRLVPYIAGEHTHFSGFLTVLFTCDRKSDIIELHAKNLDIESYSLHSVVTPGQVLHIAAYQDQQDQSQRITFILDDDLKPGSQYRLHINYKGYFNMDGPSMGVFTESYNTTDGPKTMMATTLRPNHARSLFPCIDMPNHKARFQVTVDRPHGFTVLSNTVLEASSIVTEYRIRDSFAQTQPLSPFHLAVVMFPEGDWQVAAHVDAGQVSCDLWMSRDSVPLGGALLRYVDRDVQYLAEYTGIPLMFKKMDFVTYLAYHTSAFEHPGLVTIKESNIYPPASGYFDKAAKTVTHELGHQWFGNLVSIESWGDLWLSEGLTCLVAMKAVRRHHDHARQYVTFSHFTQLYIMQLDGTDPGIHPLYQTFTGIPSRNDIYHLMTWSKGHAVARVLELYAGEHVFRQVLQTMLQEYKWRSISVQEFLELMWRVAQIEPPLAEIALNWFNDTGYPLIGVQKLGQMVECDIYHLNPVAMEHVHPVTLEMLYAFQGPLEVDYEVRYVNGDVRRGTLRFAGLTSQLSLRLDDDDLEYLMLNTGGLYVRVMYDDALWDKLLRVFNTEDLLAHSEGRASVIEDARTLSQHGLIEGHIYQNLTQTVCNETMTGYYGRDDRSEEYQLDDAQWCHRLHWIKH